MTIETAVAAVKSLPEFGGTLDADLIEGMVNAYTDSGILLDAILDDEWKLIQKNPKWNEDYDLNVASEAEDYFEAWQALMPDKKELLVQKVLECQDKDADYDVEEFMNALAEEAGM